MPVNTEIRASDADRDHVAAMLRDHTVEGRLTLDEMQERIDATYTARTLGDLQRLVADLPATSARPPARQTAPPGRHVRGQSARWVTYAAVCLLCVVIWVATSLSAGAVEYFWPFWVIGPWGAALVAKTIGLNHRCLAAPGRR